MGSLRVLGIDLGPGAWRNNGSALLTFEVNGVFEAVQWSVVPWPQHLALNASVVAETIDRFARHEEIAAVAIDGPQGWRDPGASPDRRGVGRASEASARTPGKTGTEGIAYPSTQLGWIRFSIALFDELIRRFGAPLANDPAASNLEPRESGYIVLECFPTSTWRSSGLVPLPSKSKRPSVQAFATDLFERYEIPCRETPTSHDDLQAVVAALSAAALFGAGRSMAHGEPARDLIRDDHIVRVEGLIWDAAPMNDFPLSGSSTVGHGDEDLLRALVDGDLHRFADWPNQAVPRVAAGAYTIWDDDQLLYVGMAGRSLTPGAPGTPGRNGRRTGLFPRLAAHASLEEGAAISSASTSPIAFSSPASTRTSGIALQMVAFPSTR